MISPCYFLFRRFAHDYFVDLTRRVSFIISVSSMFTVYEPISDGVRCWLCSEPTAYRLCGFVLCGELMFVAQKVVEY